MRLNFRKRTSWLFADAVAMTKSDLGLPTAFGYHGAAWMTSYAAAARANRGGKMKM